MVRTYAINALTQSSDNIFNNNPPRRGTWSQERFEEPQSQAQWNNRHQTPPEDPMPPQTQTRPYVQEVQQTPVVPLPVQSYNMPSFLHSPYLDPVGSIIGLRVVYSEGKITYIPVEPHINYMINQQYGVPMNSPPQMASPNSNSYQHPQQQQQQQQQTQQYQQPQYYQQRESQQQMYKPYQQQQEAPVPQRQRQQQYSRTDSERWLPNRVDTPVSVQSMPAQQSQREPQHAVRRRSNDMNGDWFPSNPQPRSGIRRSREWNNEVDTDYNPWGRGGGGSPLKDSMGNLVTDRRLLGRSWSTMLTTNLPHALDQQPRSAPESFLSSSRNEYPSYPERTRNRMPSFAPMAVYSSMPNLNKGSMSDADAHRMELQKQIEDNRRRKELEKQREKEIEEMEMRKHEEYMAKLQRQEEEDKRRQREQAILADRRSEQIAQEQQERARQARRRSSPPPRQRTPIRQESQDRYERPPRQPERQERYDRDPEPYVRPERPDSAAPREVEWWEKKPTWQQKAEEESRKSAVIPSLRGKPPPSRHSSASRAASRHSQQRYDPSSSIQEHEEGREREQMEREAASARSRRSASRRSASVHREDSREDVRRTIDEEPPRMATPGFGQNVSNDARGRPTAFVIQ